MYPTTKPKIVVLNPFPVYPPLSGGQGRVFHLYKHFAETYNVVIICFADLRSCQVIFPGLVQILVPKSPAHCQMELAMYREAGFSTCAITLRAANLTPEYAYVLNEQAKDASAIVLSHPYLYNVVQSMHSNIPIIYDAHNVEYDLHQQILPTSLGYLLADIHQAEKSACEHSVLIATCSQQDAGKIAELYSIKENKFIIVPNGAATEAIPFVAFNKRKSLKTAYKILQPMIIYIGSCYRCNIQAAERVIEIAEQLPAAKFIILGSLCTVFNERVLPKNIELLGVVSEQVKYHFLSISDIALNPVLSGSGTNLKMFEYMAAGIPIITTLLGARGLPEDNDKYFIISECRDMPSHILNLLNNPALAACLAGHAYQLVTTCFAWQQIAGNFAKKLSTIIG